MKHFFLRPILLLYLLVGFSTAMPLRPDLMPTNPDGSINTAKMAQALPRFPSIIETPSPKFAGGTPAAVKALVVLVDFPDRSAQKNASEFQSLLFDANNAGSMRSYYREISCGQFTVDGMVTVWVRAPRRYDYYCEADGTHDNGFATGDLPRSVFGLVRDAAAAVPAIYSSQVNSTFDVNNDGYIDALFIVHQGPGAEAITNATTRKAHIWSHKSDLRAVDMSATMGSLKVGTYSMEPELLNETGSQLITMGVFAHEFGHVLGLPDLYDTDYSSNGVGRFCLMAAGSWLGAPVGSSPAHMSAWCKYFLGWIDPTEVQKEAYVTIAPIESTAASSMYRLMPNPHGNDWTGEGSGFGEYFLVENRQKTGFDAYLPGSGLLVWHIDESMPNNDNDQHRLSAVMKADGDATLSTKGEAADFWVPGKEFSDATTPNSNFYDQNATGVTVTQINTNGFDISALLKVGVVFFAKVISYPNPYKKIRASDRLTISYFPSDADEAQDQFPDFHIAIYTMAGELVRVLDREDKSEIARLERKAFWDGKNDDGKDAAAGMYWYVLEGAQGRNKGHFTFIH